jgi:hypothetical protein
LFTFIALSFGFFDPNIVQVDNLPANLVVNINSKSAILPSPKPTSKPNADIVRPGRSIDITPLCRLSPNTSNKVEISWVNSDLTKTYCIAVYVFKRVTVFTLMQHLRNSCIIDGEQTRKLVKEKLQISDTDLEIETSTYKVSLMCPLMKFRIQIPGRSSLCKHVQCFDLESYLMMNEKKPTWNCPVCDLHAPYDTLIIDGLFMSILKACTDCEEVQFTPEGEWSRVINKKEKLSSSDSSTSISSITGGAHQAKKMATESSSSQKHKSENYDLKGKFLFSCLGYICRRYSRFQNYFEPYLFTLY